MTATARNNKAEKRKFEEKLSLREKKYEETQRMKVKRSEEYEVLEQVFDKPTLMTVYHLMNKGVIDSFFGVVKSGKEAKIYRALSPTGEELAIKIYLTVSAEFKKGMLPYIEGDTRFSRVKHDTYSLVYAWALKEFKNLKKAYEIGVTVPKPFTVEKNVLVMEFIGDEGVPAPLLKDVKLLKPQKFYEKLLNFVKILYREGGLIHGDLSEYNVMVKDEEPVIFDVSQAVLLSHPMSKELLHRDITNLNRFFEKFDIKIKNEDEIYKWITENDSKL